MYTPTESDEEGLPSREADTAYDSEDETPSQLHQDTRPNWARDSTSASGETEDLGLSEVVPADEDILGDWEFLSAGSIANDDEQPITTAPEPDARPEHQADDNNTSPPSEHTEEEMTAPRRPPEANQPGFERAEDWGVKYFNRIAEDLDMTNVLCDGLRDQDFDLMDTSPG